MNKQLWHRLESASLTRRENRCALSKQEIQLNLEKQH